MRLQLARVNVLSALWYAECQSTPNLGTLWHQLSALLAPTLHRPGNAAGPNGP